MAVLLNLDDPELIADPYPVFAARRAEHSIAWDDGVRVPDLRRPSRQAADASAVDLVPNYADQLPVAVIAELLGVPESDRPLLRPCS